MNCLQKSAKIQQVASDATLTVVAPGQGKYNCLSYISVNSSAGCTITVVGKVTWQVRLAGAGGWTFEQDDCNVFMGAENTAVTISVSAGNYDINVLGFVHP